MGWNGSKTSFLRSLHVSDLVIKNLQSVQDGDMGGFSKSPLGRVSKHFSWIRLANMALKIYVPHILTPESNCPVIAAWLRKCAENAEIPFGKRHGFQCTSKAVVESQMACNQPEHPLAKYFELTARQRTIDACLKPSGNFWSCQCPRAYANL